MALQCEYRIEEKTSKGFTIGRCGKPVNKPFRIFDTGIDFGVLDLGSAFFSNARCDEHYGMKNPPIKGLDLDIDAIVEQYGKKATPKGDGYITEK